MPIKDNEMKKHVINVNGTNVDVIDHVGGFIKFEKAFRELSGKKEFYHQIQEILRIYKSLVFSLKARDEKGVVMGGLGSSSTNNSIIIDMNYSMIQYKTNLNAVDFSHKFDHIEDMDKAWAAEDKYIKDNEYFTFSLKRHIAHEVYHSLNHPGGSAKYALAKSRYEGTAIESTNKFMNKYYDEPYRSRNHGLVRSRP